MVNLTQLVLLLLLKIILTTKDTAALGVSSCYSNSSYYKPCSCYVSIFRPYPWLCPQSYGEETTVSCFSFYPISDMTAAFNSFQTKQYVGSLSLAISGSIDANVLGKVTVGSLGINCYSSSLPLTVNPSAFTGTKLVTSSLTLSGCDLSKLDWTFVTGFTNLSSISISSSSNFHTTFYTLPSASLTKLAILSLASGDLNGFSSSSVNYPAVLEQGLKGLYINSGYGPHADSGPQYTTTGMSDTAIEFFLAKWVTPTSSKTLNNLALNNLYLTRIPSDVFKYTNLTKFEIKDNRKFLVVQANSFNISQRNDDGLPFQLTLYNNYITTIQAGAFQGSYANSSLSINYDSGLTTFDSGVFETLLQQMTQPGSYGRIDVTNIPFDCAENQCGLAWLFRGNYLFMAMGFMPMCSNGTYFHNLNGNTLQYPNGTACP